MIHSKNDDSVGLDDELEADMIHQDLVVDDLILVM
jgi:hypothetical protein